MDVERMVNSRNGENSWQITRKHMRLNPVKSLDELGSESSLGFLQRILSCLKLDFEQGKLRSKRGHVHSYLWPKNNVVTAPTPSTLFKRQQRTNRPTLDYILFTVHIAVAASENYTARDLQLLRGMRRENAARTFSQIPSDICPKMIDFRKFLHI